jgi:hypothetical protein
MAIKWGKVQKLKKITKLANPARKKKKAAGSRRKNSAQPKKENHIMAKKKAKSAAAKPKSVRYVFMNNPHKRKRKSNPHRSRSRRKRNPILGKSAASAGGSVVREAGRVVRFGVVGAGAGIAIRELTQYGLGARNVGALGYAANIAVTVAAAMAARALGLSKADVAAIAAGGGIGTVLRVHSDMSNPVLASMSLNGLGDASTIQSGAAIRSRLAGARPRGLQPAAQSQQQQAAAMPVQPVRAFPSFRRAA